MVIRLPPAHCQNMLTNNVRMAKNSIKNVWLIISRPAKILAMSIPVRLARSFIITQIAVPGIILTANAARLRDVQPIPAPRGVMATAAVKIPVGMPANTPAI